jgi:hypothetical protein
MRRFDVAKRHQSENVGPRQSFETHGLYLDRADTGRPAFSPHRTHVIAGKPALKKEV